MPSSGGQTCALRSEEHTSELQSLTNIVCRLLLEKTNMSYSMFYMANAVLLKYGYKTQDKIAHKVTSDALIVLVLDKLKKERIEDYEAIQKDALEIAGAKAESVIESYSLELDKRSRFQYNMLEQTKEAKAQTSLKRASEFVFELKKLLKGK